MPTRKQPLVKLGPVASPVLRTGAQGGVTYMVMEAIEAYGLYDFTERQWAITMIIGTGVASLVQNTIEARRGRKLIGVRAGAA